MLINKKAISPLILIILLLCSAVFGALISYLWVMANYYSMPEDTTMLIVEKVVFPDFPNLDCTYFNVTILNPSNSLSDVNITAIRLTVEGKNELYSIVTTEPVTLPFLLKRGTRQTFKCLKNWSNFAGETVKIEPVAANISTLSYSCQTPNAKLTLQPTFDVEVSVEYFNLTVKNSGTLNLTLSEIVVQAELISNNVTPQLPYLLTPEQSETFKCNWSWDWAKVGIQNITIKAKTVEGYETNYTINELPGAYLYIDELRFDYSDTSYFNLTISSSKFSTATAYLNQINLTLADETIILDTIPPNPIPIPPNSSLTIKCLWDWNTHRNQTINVSVYTKQGFIVPTITESLPSDVIWNITDVIFDLDYTDYFLVNVTNMPCSVREITVIQIMLNGSTVDINPPYATLSNGTQEVFNCSIPWRDYIGKTANITVLTTEGSISRFLEIPVVGLKILGENPVFGDLQDPEIGSVFHYINITISNSVNSLQNVTITKIIIEGNGTCEIDGSLSNPELIPDGYTLKVGETVTIICPWNYIRYLPQGGSLTVTIYTFEDVRISKTWYVPTP